MRKLLKDYLICTLGAFLFVGAINLVIAPIGLYSGGFVGIGQLARYVLEEFAGIKSESFDLAGFIYFVLNVPLFVLAYKSMSKKFFWKTIYTVVIQTILLAVVPIPEEAVIKDMLTSCIVGGLFAGIGVGIVLKASSCGGGQDILGIYCSKLWVGFSVGKITIAVNLFVYGCCALLFDIEIVVYSLIYTAIMSFVIDKLHSQNINNTMLIITKKPGLEKVIVDKGNRGATLWRGLGGYTEEGVNVVLTCLSKFEIKKLKKIILEFDKDAFIIVNDNIPIYGNFEKRLDT